MVVYTVARQANRCGERFLRILRCPAIVIAILIIAHSKQPNGIIPLFAM